MVPRLRPEHHRGMEPTPILERPVRPLRRSREGRLLAGIAVGLADYFEIDPVIARIVLVALAFVGVGVPLYLAGWLLIPEAGTDESIAEQFLGRPGRAEAPLVWRADLPASGTGNEPEGDGNVSAA
jgi:phage shock protein PspC (stress-responsive transcriptional regulator)